ncbi:MAG TPA: regulatory iron-sulfur-containing complex subunit RicT [Polyangia bacterium]|nr:regulatory iron-sulfur-containing complex subunit RicT [Polyangia bacterium]
MSGEPPPGNGAPLTEPAGGASPAGAGAGPPVVNLVGVKLSPTGRTFGCDAGALAPRVGDRVVLDDEDASVATVAVTTALRAATPPLPRLLRLADARDLARLEADRRRADDALAFARERARARNLPIKMFRVELHAGGRATFYFAAEQRIDFRELVRDLASRVRARVEMRQVGVRDEAKMVGGIGSCGRELCCSTFLPKFAPVSIKMAKNQNLALNPTKVSGQCGRLKCCLVYEEANYVEAAKRLPRSGKRVTTPEGVGRVGDVDVLRERVRVYFEDQPPKVFPAAEVRLIAPPGEPPRAGAGAEPREPAPRDETPPDGAASE